MTKKISDMVVKSNTLIEASYTLTLQEIRLLDIALAYLTTQEEREKIVLTLPNMVEISASEYAKTYGISMDMAYEALRDASERLFSRYFTYYVPMEDFKHNVEVRKARWVNEIGYIEGRGIVKLGFSEHLIELAGRLKNKFSRYHLEQKAPLTSVYAHRLYEMMMQWRNKQTVPSLSYLDLRDRFDIDKGEYSRITNFKARVLDPAVKQINDHTDITVSYKQYKEGKNIAGFIFKVKHKKEKVVANKALKLVEKSNIDNEPATKKTKHSLPNIPAMSDKQRNTFAHKMLNNFDFIRDYSSMTIGKNREELIPLIEKGLQDDVQRQEWCKYLLMTGYELPDAMKK